MMGLTNTNNQHDLFVPGINMDLRVRSDHPLRKIAQALDLGFVREEVARFYGHNGNPSVDPEVLVKMLLLLFLDDVSSERELMRIIPERLDYLWFLGYKIDDAIPNHSVLSKARKRWGAEVFESIFVRTVQQCAQAGLIDGRKIHMDSSLIDANASNNAVSKSSPELVRRLKEAFQKEERKLHCMEATPSQAAPGETSPVAKGVNKTLVNLSDPEAPVVSRLGKGARARYKSHRVVDDAHGVVTAVETTGGDVADGQRLGTLVAQHEANAGQSVGTVVADSGYGTTENFVSCQQRGICSHMASMAQTQEAARQNKGLFHEDQFHYDAGNDAYLCPAGHAMKPRRLHSTRRTREYFLPKKICGGCPLRQQCTKAKTSRTIQRHEHQEALTEARRQSGSAKARRDRSRRKHLMEGSFADAANNHGFKRARWRGLWRQSIQDYLIAAVQNLRLLIARGGRKPTLHAVASILPITMRTVCESRGFASGRPVSAALPRATCSPICGPTPAFRARATRRHSSSRGGPWIFPRRRLRSMIVQSPDWATRR